MSGDGPLSVFLEGLGLLREESSFALGTALRRLEARSLEKRLDEECARGEGRPEADLARVQAAFLAEELRRVRAGIAARHEERRREKAARREDNY